MRNLILYASTHGCTENCAQKLQEGLEGESVLLHIRRATEVSLADFDRILIGGSIHAGRIQKAVRRFCENKIKVLLKKTIGLFLCCMEEGETADEQFQNAFPEKLRKHATVTGLFGGAFDFDRMTGIERVIVRRIAKVEESVSKISEEQIENFIDAINKCG